MFRDYVELLRFYLRGTCKQVAHGDICYKSPNWGCPAGNPKYHLLTTVLSFEVGMS